MKRIESASNPQFRMFKSLLDSKGIKKEGLFLVFGQKIIEETCQAAHRESRFILATQEMADEAHRLNRFLPDEGRTIFLDKILFEELNELGIDYPIAVFQAPEFPPWEDKSGPALVCPFQNPQNLGAAMRSALAFNFKVILTRESANPLHPKCIRSLSGNIFSQKIEVGPPLSEVPESSKIFLLDGEGDDIAKVNFPKDAVFVIGEEGRGIPNTLKGRRITIPIDDRQESLNAMAALSIAAFQFRQQHKL